MDLETTDAKRKPPVSRASLVAALVVAVLVAGVAWYAWGGSAKTATGDEGTHPAADAPTEPSSPAPLSSQVLDEMRTVAQERRAAQAEAAQWEKSNALAHEQAKAEERAAQAAAQTHPLSYVWTCGKDYYGVAPDDGSLIEWAPHYYVAHSYGDYGKAIIDMEPGDHITINGDEVTVEGVTDLPDETYYVDVMDAVGWEVTVFQTCVENSGYTHYVYCRGAGSTPEAAAEARAFAGVDEEGALTNENREAWDALSGEEKRRMLEEWYGWAD